MEKTALDLHAAVLQNLVALAAADGTLSGEERVLIELYRQALRMERSVLDRLVGQAARGECRLATVPGTGTDRISVLRMLTRVAMADGHIVSRERRLIDRFAQALEIDSLHVAESVVEVEIAERRRRRRQKTWLVTAAAFSLAVLAVVTVLTRESSKKTEGALRTADLASARADKAGRDRLEAARIREEAAGDRDDAARERLETARMHEDKALDQKAIRQMVDEMLRPLSFDVEILALDHETEVFREIEAKYRSSILLLGTYWYEVKGSERRYKGSSGTGFFVTPEGHILTNKHVVEPWKYRAESAQALQHEGFVVEDVLRVAWPAGATVRTPSGNLDLSTGYHSRAPKGRRIELRGTLPDRTETVERKLEDGTTFRGQMPVLDSSDLALLKADLAEPVLPLRLHLEEEGVAVLDPVLVMGYAGGSNLLETDRAIHTVTPGHVRRIDDSLFLNNAIHRGNSGGPAIDARGTVIGVVARAYQNDATFGACVRPLHARPLLPGAEHLLRQAHVYESEGHPGCALDDLVLARALSTSEETSRAIDDTIQKLLTDRDDLLRSLTALLENGKPQDAEPVEKELRERYGRTWCGLPYRRSHSSSR